MSEEEVIGGKMPENKAEKMKNSLRDFGRRKFINVQMNRNTSFGKKNTNSSGKQWVHPADALVRGHIVYNVKFLGHVEVDQPKGIDVVKQAIQKMKFNKQIKRAEGQKPPKVELTISVDGVTVQEPKYKVIQHQYPLHRISYCADDKSDKRMFTFIAKEADTTVHHCFVFDSDKCAEEITLTIGQAFDLAYKRFVENSGKDMDMKKQFLLLQKKVQQLTSENLQLKARVADLERLIDPKILDDFDKNKLNQNNNQHKPTEAPSVGRRLEGLLFDDEKPATNGTSNGTSSQSQQALPFLAPPPPVPPRQNMPQPAVTAQSPQQSGPVDPFGATPFTPPMQQQQPSSNNPFNTGGAPAASDPFGMPSFSPSQQQDLDNQIMKMDKELMDLQVWEDSWPWNYIGESASSDIAGFPFMGVVLQDSNKPDSQDPDWSPESADNKVNQDKESQTKVPPAGSNTNQTQGPSTGSNINQTKLPPAGTNTNQTQVPSTGASTNHSGDVIQATSANNPFT